MEASEEAASAKASDQDNDKDQLAGGRSLPDLLFVTSKKRLSRRLGADATAAIKLITSAGQSVFDIDTVNSTAPWVGAAKAAVGKEGVVLVGGYDVVPSIRTDCLPSNMRARLGKTRDYDDFIVWCDDFYADANGDEIADIPVSRIPDAGSADLLLDALKAVPKTPPKSRFGLRNSKRPFADAVFAKLSGSEAMLQSEPVDSAVIVSSDLDAAGIYVMLHGSSSDTATFWGEDSQGGSVKALTVSNVLNQSGGTVFAGCCWGALTVEEPACDSPVGSVPTSLPINDSIALTFLANGTGNFVGCTGAHYSPVGRGFGSQVLHQAFWEHIAAGTRAAEALFKAKGDFATALLSRVGSMTEVGLKTHRQFTCLGLGW